MSASAPTTPVETTVVDQEALKQQMKHQSKDVLEVKKALNAEREAYLKKVGVDPTHDAAASDESEEKKSVITKEHLETVLGYLVRWGKYKGSSYREIYIKDPRYFQRTVLSGLSNYPLSTTYRALVTLKDKKVQGTNPMEENKRPTKAVSKSPTELEMPPPAKRVKTSQ